MESSMLGVQPTMPLASANNDMFGGNAFMWLILIFLLFGRGFGYAGQDVNVNDEFIKRDLFNMQTSNQACCCETQKEIIENRYTNQLGLQNLGQQMASCCCETNRNIDAVRADAYKNTCEITTAIHAEGEATRALINANTIQDLRDRLEARDRDLLTANFQLSQQAQSANIIETLQPTLKPAFVVQSPYVSYGYNPCGYSCNNM